MTCDGRFVKDVEKDGGGRMDGYGVAGAYASPSGLQPVRVSADESFGCEWAYRARAVLLCSCSAAQWPCCAAAVLCCAVLCRAKLRSEHLLSARHQKAQPDQGLCPQSPLPCRGCVEGIPLIAISKQSSPALAAALAPSQSSAWRKRSCWPTTARSSFPHTSSPAHNPNPAAKAERVSAMT